MNDDKVIGTDNTGKSKIRVKSKYTITLIKSDAFNEDTVDFCKDMNFKNIFEFIDYISEHGKEILDDIDNGNYDYSIQINLEGSDFVYADVLTNSADINIQLDADFLDKEMQEDKKALHDIMDIANKRLSWGNERKWSNEVEK